MGTTIIIVCIFIAFIAHPLYGLFISFLAWLFFWYAPKQKFENAKKRKESFYIKRDSLPKEQYDAYMRFITEETIRTSGNDLPDGFKRTTKSEIEKYNLISLASQDPNLVFNPSSVDLSIYEKGEK